MVQYSGLEGIFNAPLPDSKSLLECTERFLFTDLIHHTEEIHDFLGTHLRELTRNNERNSGVLSYHEKYYRPRFDKMQKDYDAGKDILGLQDERSSITIQTLAFYISIFPNGFANIGFPNLGVSLGFLHPENPAIRTFFYNKVREIVNIMQPDLTKREVLYSDDLVEIHYDLLERDEKVWLTPFSLEAHIDSLRLICPENERSLDHDFTKDWKKWFKNNPYPFFMVDENISS